MALKLRKKIKNLIGYANAVTGAEDTNLTDAVGTLIDGYGGTITQTSITGFLHTPYYYTHIQNAPCAQIEYGVVKIE